MLLKVNLARDRNLELVKPNASRLIQALTRALFRSGFLNMTIASTSIEPGLTPNIVVYKKLKNNAQLIERKAQKG